MLAITGTTKLLGVIGHPIEHSLSPVMHNAAIRAIAETNPTANRGLDYVYLPFAIAPENLEAALAGFAAIGVVGFNVTIPHKQAIIPFLSEVSAIARSVGSVNTVWRGDRGWIGTNTDVEGFLSPLKHYDRDWSQTVAVVLGHGGAARSVVAGCMQLGCTKVCVVGRDREKLKKFLHSWTDKDIANNLHIYQWEELPRLIPEADLLINSTPIGMYPNIEQSPLDKAAMQLSKTAIVYDLIYTPNPTQFLRQAQAQGAITIDGLEMLVQQGAAALQIWLQQPVPVDVMRQALYQHIVK